MDISKKDKELIRQKTDAAIINFVNHIPDKVDEILTKVLLSLIGAKKGWGNSEYEVDTTNGRQSLLTRMLSGRCTAAVEKAFEPIFQKAIDDLAKNKKFWETIAKDMSKRFTEAVAYKLGNRATEWANDQANKIIENLDNVTLKPLYTDPLDIENPKGCDSQIENLLMEEFAEVMAKAISQKPK